MVGPPSHLPLQQKKKSRLAQVSLKKLSSQLGAILLQHLVIKSATFATPPFRLTPTSAVKNGSDCSFLVSLSDISWKILPQLDVRFITSPARSPLQTNEMSTSGPCHAVQDHCAPCRRNCDRSSCPSGAPRWAAGVTAPRRKENRLQFYWLVQWHSTLAGNPLQEWQRHCPHPAASAGRQQCG